MLKRNKLTGLLLACALGLLTAGISLGQYTAVHAKAIRVCLECVGLG